MIISTGNSTRYHPYIEPKGKGHQVELNNSASVTANNYSLLSISDICVLICAYLRENQAGECF